MHIIPGLLSSKYDSPLFSIPKNSDKQSGKLVNSGGASPKLLIVDDDEDIHTVTELVLEAYTYQHQSLEILHAYSANHAKQVLEQNPDVMVLLLDVVMETDHAGLDLVNYIRNEINNKRVRIILRTGQPGQAPETQVIQDYDINDYREKSDLTAEKLITSVTAAIRSYQDINTIEQLALKNSNLEFLVDQRTYELKQINQHLDQLIIERTSELQSAMEKAESANLAKTTFLSRVSHELRTPLNAILGFAQLMKLDEEILIPDHRGSVDEILKAGDYLLNLISELIEISRIETGQAKLHIEEVSICHLIDEVILLMQPAAEKLGIHFSTMEMEQGNFIINTDANRLRQVLINLINNAVKYNHPNGNIRINFRVEEKHHQARISITDTGIGIAPEHQAMIFQPFLRVNEYSHAEGSGVGLSVCKQIVELLGGEIGVESEQGKGSTFWFTLPLHDASNH